MSISKIVKAVTEARAGDADVARLCVVGVGPELTRVTRALSAGAADGSSGVSAALDVLSPADFPADDGLGGRWDIVVLVAAGCTAADMAPVVAAVRAAGRQIIALVEVPYGELDRRGRASSTTRSPAASAAITPVRPASRTASCAPPATAPLALAVGLPAVRRAYCDHVVLANALSERA